MEQASVVAGADFIDDVGLEIAVDGSWNIFAVSYSAAVSAASAMKRHIRLPVSEKKVLKPWSASEAFRSSVKYPSGCSWLMSVLVKLGCLSYLDAVLETVQLRVKLASDNAMADDVECNEPPSMSWQSGNQPDRLLTNMLADTRLSGRGVGEENRGGGSAQARIN